MRGELSVLLFASITLTLHLMTKGSKADDGKLLTHFADEMIVTDGVLEQLVHLSAAEECVAGLPMKDNGIPRVVGEVILVLKTRLTPDDSMFVAEWSQLGKFRIGFRSLF